MLLNVNTYANSVIESSFALMKFMKVLMNVYLPFAVHLRKRYIHLRQQWKLYGKYTFISTFMNFNNVNELSE